MKLDKKKLIYASVLLVVLLFLGSYTYIIATDSEETPTLTQPDLPEWEESEIEYQNKKQALDAFKEERETLPPSLYEDHMIDDKGYFNPDYMEFEKHRIIDSIYLSENFQRPEPLNFKASISDTEEMVQPKKEEEELSAEHQIALSLSHQLFFATNPKWKLDKISPIVVEVAGNQILKKDSRIKLRLAQDIEILNQSYSKNTIVWGIVNFKPNRVEVSVSHIGNKTLALHAIDFKDGLNGIYIENSIKSEVTNELLDDAVDDINIAGFPQISGLKSIFQRHHRNLKITVLDGYKLRLQTKNQ